MAEGLVYILRNQGHKDNYLKIGKTTRTVAERIKELSRHTGVPKPYEEAYSIFFNDCDIAEKQMHQLLNAYRQGDDREFFEVDLWIAIKQLAELKIKELEYSKGLFEAEVNELKQTIIIPRIKEKNFNICPQRFGNENDNKFLFFILNLEEIAFFLLGRLSAKELILRLESEVGLRAKSIRYQSLYKYLKLEIETFNNYYFPKKCFNEINNIDVELKDYLFGESLVQKTFDVLIEICITKNIIKGFMNGRQRFYVTEKGILSRRNKNIDCWDFSKDELEEIKKSYIEFIEQFINTFD